VRCMFLKSDSRQREDVHLFRSGIDGPEVVKKDSAVKCLQTPSNYGITGSSRCKFGDDE
jgi:hypothetical protein